MQLRLFVRKRKHTKLDDLNFIGYNSIGPFFAQDNRFVTVTHDIEKADAVAFHITIDVTQEQIQEVKKYPNIKYVFGLHLYHMWEEMHDGIEYPYSNINVLENEFNKIGVHFIYLHTNPLCSKGIHFDYMWNRQKACYVDYEKYGYLRHYYEEVDSHIGGATQKMFQLARIDKKYSKNTKAFLAPMRTSLAIENFNERIFRRIALRYFIDEYDGYISDPDKGRTLECQSPEDIQDTPESGFEGFSPVHVKYYESSYVSIYVETLNYKLKEAPVCGLTEKTFTPLLQGHFVLPYGYNGLVHDIRGYGFLLPDWIDYSYDNIESDRHRFRAYLLSVKKLLSISLDDLEKYYEKDKWTLEFNRQILYDRPFDNLYEKVASLKYFSYI